MNHFSSERNFLQGVGGGGGNVCMLACMPTFEWQAQAHFERIIILTYKRRGASPLRGCSTVISSMVRIFWRAGSKLWGNAQRATDLQRFISSGGLCVMLVFIAYYDEGYAH
jgi:hypothetical protein